MSEPSSFLPLILTKYGINNSLLLLIVLMVIMILSLFYTSSDIGVSETQSYAAIISVVMIIIIISIFKLVTNKTNLLMSYAVVALISIFIFGGFFVEFYKKYIKHSDLFDRASRDPTTRIAMNIVEISLIISIAFVGISFANNVFGRYLNNSTDWFGFIINFIIYVPCLLEDLVKYLKQQYNLTSSVTFILLAIECVLVAVYIAFPMLFKSKLLNDSIQIINEPAFLDIPVNRIFKDEDNGEKTRKRANYAISLWVYLNQQNSSNEKAKIFSYGNSHLKIDYIKSKTDTGKDNYRFTVSGQAPYDISMPNQKWNNIVVNFNENKTIDIFVNGNLERTFTSSNRDLKLNSWWVNTITIGSTNGLYGAICNVKYYRTPLTNTQIVQNYNLLYNKNPPVNKIV